MEGAFTTQNSPIPERIAFPHITELFPQFLFSQGSSQTPEEGTTAVIRAAERVITEFGGGIHLEDRGVSTSVMSGLHRIFRSSERLRKIHRGRFLTQLPTSEIARGLFRLWRADRYQNQCVSS